MTASQKAVPLSNLDREGRERANTNALWNVRAEGGEPSDAAKAIAQRYIDGEISAAQASEETIALHRK